MDFLNDIDADLNFFDSNNENLLNVSFTDAYFDADKFNNSFQYENGSLNIIHINIRSMRKNIDNFVAFLETLKFKFQVLCFSETWLNEIRVIENIFPDFSSFHSMRPVSSSPGGGVAIYISNEFISSEILSYNDECMECLFADVSDGNSRIIVGSCYRPPNADSSTFITEISTKIRNFGSISPIVLCGDFNYNLLDINSNSRVADFMDAMFGNGLVHTIENPTRVTENCSSIIDNIFLSNSLSYQSGIFAVELTDHFPIFTSVKSIFSRIQRNHFFKYRLVNETTMNKFKQSLLNYDFEGIKNTYDIDNAVEKFNEILLTEYNLNCPIITKKITKKDQERPWITNRLKGFLKHRQNSYLRFKSGQISFDEFKRIRNQVTGELRVSKREYYSKLLNDFRDNIKKTWNILNNILKPNKIHDKSNINSLLINGTLINDKKRICETFNNYFAGVGSSIAGSFQEQEHRMCDSRVCNSFFFRYVSVGEIKNIIQGMKNKSDLTCYSTKILKNVVDIVAPVLTVIVNKSLNRGYFPDSQKLARVVAIHKSGPEIEINNYRPVSILPILSKIFERVVHNQLYGFLEKFKILSDCQFGFRKKRSTIQAVMNNLKFVYDNLDAGRVVVSFFMDFSKAFDCLDHRLLLGKLWHYGVRGIPYYWFKSYLENRRQYVSIGNVVSQSAEITYGVPQGSILGPLLFLIFINDFPRSNSFFKFNLYADDSTLTCTFQEKNPNYIKSKLETELRPIYHWLEMNKIKVNYSKSKYIAFSYKNHVSYGDVEFGNGLLSNTASLKFLGIEVDENLNFKNHVGNICTKISKTVGLLFRLGHYLPMDALKTLYNSLIFPRLDYGLIVWHGCPQGCRDRIFVLQKKAIRAINSLPYNHHTSSYFKSMNFLKLEDLFKLKILTNMHINFDYVSQSDLHGYSTRNRNNLTTPLYNRAKTQSTWFYLGIQLWNSLPDFIRNLKSTSKFKRDLKTHLINEY